MKKAVWLLLPLLVAAVSCASVPDHAGGGSPDRHVGADDGPRDGVSFGDVAFRDVSQYDVLSDGERPEAVDAEPTIAESTEHVPAEAGFPEVAFEEPGSTESVPAEVVIVEPFLAEPIPTEVAFEEPVQADPISTEIVIGESVLAESVPAEPAIEEPVWADPVYTEVAIAEPLSMESIYTESAQAEQVSADDPIAEAPPEESVPAMARAEPAIPDFTQGAEPEPAALEPTPVIATVASNPDANPNPDSNPGNIAIAGPPPSTVAAPQSPRPPATNPNPNPNPIAAIPVQAPPAPPVPFFWEPVSPLPDPMVAPSVAAWEPPVFIASLPEPSNPVPDFRNLLPPPVVFSRTVNATVGQVVEVPFNGNGWIFLGETGGRRGINFDARRPDAEGQTFVFRTETAGEYALRFYRQDFVRDVILNDHVRIIVGQADDAGWPAGAGRVVAERWPAPIDAARIHAAAGRSAPPEPADAGYPVAAEPAAPLPATTVAVVQVPAPPEGGEPTAPTIQDAETPPQIPPPVPPPPPPAPAVAPPTPAAPPPQATADIAAGALMDAPLGGAAAFGDPFDLLEMARGEFDAGRVAEAIAMLDLFVELHPSGSDEAWWLYGQFFEADSPSRNILYALSFYHRLVREFPQSGRLTAARGRIAFLERFFINIR